VALASGGGASSPGKEASAPAHTCPNCKAPMAEDQDWCVQCGTNDEHSLRLRASSTAAVALLAVSAVMVSGAAAAGVAALQQGSDKEPPHTPLLVQVPSNSVVTTQTTAPISPGTPETLKTPGTSASAQTLTSSSSHSAAPVTPAPAPSASSSTETTTQTTTTAPPEPIELQAQDLSVYNPGSTYPATAIGDPRRNFEEGATTLWSVQVQPPGAPEVDVGLLVHFSNGRHVGKLEVITSTPGYTLEVFGTTATKPPTAITAKAWKPLGHETKLKKKTMLTLKHTSERFHYVVLWISKVPASLAGTTSAPGHVAIDELALFPAPTSG